MDGLTETEAELTCGGLLDIFVKVGISNSSSCYVFYTTEPC